VKWQKKLLFEVLLKTKKKCFEFLFGFFVVFIVKIPIFNKKRIIV